MTERCDSFRRHIAIFALFTLAATLVSCGLLPGDPPAGRELALSLDERGEVLAWYKPCGGSNGVDKISLTIWKNAPFQERTLLWQVMSTDFLDIEVFEIGGVVPGFESVRPLERSLTGQRLVLTLLREDHFSPSEVFDVSELRQGSWLRLDEYRTQEEFAALNTCDY